MVVEKAMAPNFFFFRRPALRLEQNSLYVELQICSALLQPTAIGLFLKTTQSSDGRPIKTSSSAMNSFALHEKNSRMFKGTVKFFSAQRGFGFIAPDDGSKDVFVHVSEVEHAGIAPLRERQKVTFEIFTDGGRIAAVKLQAA